MNKELRAGALAAGVRDFLASSPCVFDRTARSIRSATAADMAVLCRTNEQCRLVSEALGRHGIDSVVLERRDRAYVERRLRAGVLEHGTVTLFQSLGLSERLDREGLVHHGINLQFEGERHRVPLTDLTGGRSITIYGQHEVVKDLIAARLATNGRICFDAENASYQYSRRPVFEITWRQPEQVLEHLQFKDSIEPVPCVQH